MAAGKALPRRGVLTLLFAAGGPLHVDAGGRRIALAGGEALLLRPLMDCAGPLVSHGGDADFYVIQFRPSAPRGPRRRLEVPEHVAIRSPGRLKHLLRMFLEEEGRPGGSPLILHHLLVLMLCEMASSSLVQRGPAARPYGLAGLASIASRVDAYIAAHYHEPMGTPDIAEALRYNPDYLERAYRSERQVSIREAIHARRLREARAQLLLQRQRGIAEIAALCGYTDPGYFRRVFKRATQMTPRRYRLSESPDKALPAALRIP